MDTRNFTFMFYGFLAAWLILVVYVLSLASRERKITRGTRARRSAWWTTGSTRELTEMNRRDLLKSGRCGLSPP